MLLEVPSSDNKLPASASKAISFLCYRLNHSNCVLMGQVTLSVRRFAYRKLALSAIPYKNVLTGISRRNHCSYYY